MNKVRTIIHFPDGYDEEAIDNLIENNFDEAWLDYQSRTAFFNGSAERSNEFIRAIESVEKHDAVRTQISSF